jgi:hypothetical protein
MTPTQELIVLLTPVLRESIFPASDMQPTSLNLRLADFSGNSGMKRQY